MAHIGPVSAILSDDRATPGVVTQRTSGAVTKAPRARTLCHLFRDQGHGSIETDREYIIARLKAGVDLAMLDVRSEPTYSSDNRLAVVGVLADLAGQRQ